MRLSRRDPGPHGGVSLGRSHPHPGPCCLSPNLHSLVTAIPVKRCREVPPAASQHWLERRPGLAGHSPGAGCQSSQPSLEGGTGHRCGGRRGCCWCVLGLWPNARRGPLREEGLSHPLCPLGPCAADKQHQWHQGSPDGELPVPPPPKGTICLMVSLVMGVRARVMEEKA